MAAKTWRKKTWRNLHAGVGLAALASLSGIALAQAQEAFNWKQFDGQTITFLSSNHPWPTALNEFLPEFTAKTGIKLKFDTYNEEQMRQRLTTVLQTRSSDVDLFMTLPTREGQQYRASGWYADLKPMLDDKKLTAPDYNYGDFSPVLVKLSTMDAQTVGIPLNIEGPVVYYRKDLFEACNVPFPATLEDLPATAEKLKACKPGITPFVSRGLKGAAYSTLNPVFFNSGGSYEDPAKGFLCNDNGIKALDLYTSMLIKYGPPGVSNYTFYQITELIGQGRAFMALESSNEFGKLTSFEGRQKDIDVKLVPPGRDTGITKPSVISWHIAIPASSQKKGPAWYFIQWATSAEMEARLALKGVAPPRKSIGEDPKFKAWLSEYPNRTNWMGAILQLGSIGSSFVTPKTTRTPEAVDILGESISRVLTKDADVKTAACEADTKLKALNQ
ncbi:ABC transporter substrate-binding protein [Bosea caraganae]|nr:extracellular solute-binding protein [Bosea caraganae]